MIRKYSSTSIDTTLAAGIDSAVTTMIVATGTGSALMGGITLSAGDVFTVALDPDTTSEELVYITAQSGDTFTIDRAEAGTSNVVQISQSSSDGLITSTVSGGNLNISSHGIYSNISGVQLYSVSAPGGGGTGLTVTNSSYANVEIMSKTKSIVYSIIFG